VQQAVTVTTRAARHDSFSRQGRVCCGHDECLLSELGRGPDARPPSIFFRYAKAELTEGSFAGDMLECD
jgi:hypothetical protein